MLVSARNIFKYTTNPNTQYTRFTIFYNQIFSYYVASYSPGGSENQPD